MFFSQSRMLSLLKRFFDAENKSEKSLSEKSHFPEEIVDNGACLAISLIEGVFHDLGESDDFDAIIKTIRNFESANTFEKQSIRRFAEAIIFLQDNSHGVLTDARYPQTDKLLEKIKTLMSQEYYLVEKLAFVLKPKDFEKYIQSYLRPDRSLVLWLSYGGDSHDESMHSLLLQCRKNVGRNKYYIFESGRIGNPYCFNTVKGVLRIVQKACAIDRAPIGGYGWIISKNKEKTSIKTTSALLEEGEVLRDASGRTVLHHAVFVQNSQLMRKLLIETPHLGSICDRSGKTPAHFVPTASDADFLSAWFECDISLKMLFEKNQKIFMKSLEINAGSRVVDFFKKQQSQIFSARGKAFLPQALAKEEEKGCGDDSDTDKRNTKGSKRPFASGERSLVPL